MKKTIYESIIKTHLTYCLPVRGAKKTNNLTELKKKHKENMDKNWPQISTHKWKIKRVQNP